jgi:hypothetical protein
MEKLIDLHIRLKYLVRHHQVQKGRPIGIRGFSRSIRQHGMAAVSRQIDPESVEWIIGMLECRIVTADFSEEQVTVKTTRGCPQEGVLSPHGHLLSISSSTI